MADSPTEMRHWHDWTDPDFFMEGRQRERRFIPLFLRQILPKQLQQTKITWTGWMLLIVAMGIGSAAYNTSSNILFMTLSLLLSSLVLSGILSYVNFKKLIWTLKLPQHLQVGEVGMAEVDLHNRKRIFPSMCIVFQVTSSADKAVKRLYLRNAISAGEWVSLGWSFVPKQRGRFNLQMHGAESKFPFGFLLKRMGDIVEKTIWVWPARADYSFSPSAEGRRFQAGVSRHRVGVGNDLLNVRNYERGDAPRLIHWKATARMNKLMVRQLAQEGELGFHLSLDPNSSAWSGAQLERLCSVACALAEDLFHAGRLETLRIGPETVIAVRGLRELHDFFDLLAQLEPRQSGLSATKRVEQGHRNLITFKPRGESGVSIHVNGLQTGQA